MQLTKEEELLVLEFRKKNVNEFKTYTATEKINEFDRLYSIALSHYQGVKKGYFENIDLQKQLMFEAVLGLLGQDVWKSYNNYA